MDPTCSTVLAKSCPLPEGAIVLGSGCFTDIAEFDDRALEVGKLRARIHEDVHFVSQQNLTQNKEVSKIIEKLKGYMQQDKGVILSGPAGTGKMTVAVLASKLLDREPQILSIDTAVIGDINNLISCK